MSMIKFWVIICLLSLSVSFSFRLPEGIYELSEQNVDYTLYVPPQLEGNMILVLHDEGKDSRSYVDYWQKYAKEANFLVLAPNSIEKDKWGLEDEEMIIRIMNIISRDYDVQRVLLMGVSASGHYALYMAINNPHRFDALCNFMGLVMNSFSSELNAITQEQRMMPFLFVHGMLSEEIPSKYARWDANKFRDKGFDVTYWEVPSPDEKINSDILVWFQETISR